MKIAKKESGHASITYAEALDEALCHGWIDGQKQRHDECWWLQKFTKRGPRSLWSRINIGHIARPGDGLQVEALGQGLVLRQQGAIASKGDGQFAPQAVAHQGTLVDLTFAFDVGWPRFQTHHMRLLQSKFSGIFDGCNSLIM